MGSNAGDLTPLNPITARTVKSDSKLTKFPITASNAKVTAVNGNHGRACHQQYADGKCAGGLATQGRSRTGASISVVLFLAKVGSRAGYTKIR